MTNWEHFKQRINKMSAEEFGGCWQNEEAPWCIGVCPEDTCAECVAKWGSKPYIDPMPELETGVFVRIDDTTTMGLKGVYGVVVNNIIVCSDGTYVGNLSDKWLTEHITAVFGHGVDCFNECDCITPIWRRD